MLNPTIEPYKIIGIVKYAWARSFACLQTNKNAIPERGWFPYNHNLLTYQYLQATMTKVEKNEVSVDSNVTVPQYLKHNTTDLVAVLTFNPALTIIQYTLQQHLVDFSSGIAVFWFDKIVSTNIFES